MIQAWVDRFFGNNPARKDVLLDKECRLFMSVERNTCVVMAASKATVNDKTGWGKLEHQTGMRLDQVRKSYEFVPDEMVCCWRFPNIEKTPVIDDKFKAFSDFLKGKKPEKTMSLREYAFRLDKKIPDGEPLPDKEFSNWCAIQSSLQLKESYKTDITEMKRIMMKDTLEDADRERIAYYINLYKDNDRYLANFLDEINAAGDEGRRLEVFKIVEPAIDGTKYYKLAQVEKIQYLFSMDVHDMRSIHALCIELLCSELERKSDKKFEWTDSKDSDLAKLKLQLFRYHDLHDRLTQKEIEMKLDLEDQTSFDNLKELFIKKGVYVGKNGVPYVQPNMSTGKPVQASRTLSVPKGSQGTGFVEQMNRARGNSGIVEAKKEPAHIKDDQQRFELAKEKSESLARLSHGVLLRQEIDRYKDYPEITAAQLEWAFKQPFITTDILIANGTMVGSIMSTRFFAELENRIGDYAGIGENPFSPLDEQVITAYATILSKDIEYYGAQVESNTDMVMDGRDYREEMKRLILSKKTILTTLNPLLKQLQKVRENERLMHELDQAHEWMKTVYSETVAEKDRQEAVEKLVALIFLRHTQPKFFRYILKDIEYFNQEGNPTFLFTQLAILCRLPEYAAHGVPFRSPGSVDIIRPDQVSWMDALVARIYEGLVRYDFVAQAKAALSKVEMVNGYFEQNGKKVLPWIIKDLSLRKIELELANEKADIYRALAAYMDSCFSDTKPEEPFFLKKRIDEAEQHNPIAVDKLVNTSAKIKGKKVPDPKKGTLGEIHIQTGSMQEVITEKTKEEPVSATGVAKTGDTVPEKSAIQADATLQDNSLPLTGTVHGTGNKEETDEEGTGSEPEYRVSGDDLDFSGLFEEAEFGDDYFPEGSEETDVDDETLVGAIEFNRTDGTEGKADADNRSVYYEESLDGPDMNPMNPDWILEKSHLVKFGNKGVMEAINVVKNLLFYRVLCMNIPDVIAYLDQNRLSETEIVGLLNTCKFFCNRKKKWNDDMQSNSLERSLFEHLQGVCFVLESKYLKQTQ